MKTSKLLSVFVLIIIFATTLFSQFQVKSSTQNILIHVEPGGAVGINTTSPTGRLMVQGTNAIVNIESFNGTMLPRSASIVAINPSVSSTSQESAFGILALARGADNVASNHFGAAITGFSYGSTGTGLVATGKLGASQVSNSLRIYQGVVGNVDGDAIPTSAKYGIAVEGNVIDNSAGYTNVFAGYFQGAKSYFSHPVGIGVDQPLSLLHVNGGHLLVEWQDPGYPGSLGTSVGGLGVTTTNVGSVGSFTGNMNGYLHLLFANSNTGTNAVTKMQLQTNPDQVLKQGWFEVTRDAFVIISSSATTENLPIDICQNNLSLGSNNLKRLRISKDGIIEIGNIPEYANNAAAQSAGLHSGALYHTSGVVKVVY